MISGLTNLHNFRSKAVNIACVIKHAKNIMCFIFWVFGFLDTRKADDKLSEEAVLPPVRDIT